MGRYDFNKSPNMKTGGLILRVMRVIWSTVNSVIMDSGLCVLEGLSKMRNRGGGYDSVFIIYNNTLFT